MMLPAVVIDTRWQPDTFQKCLLPTKVLHAVMQNHGCHDHKLLVTLNPKPLNP